MKNKLPAFTFITLINNYGHNIKHTLGLDETAIQKDYEEYQDMQQDASVRDYMWSLFQRMILKGTDGDTYSSMGGFIARFEGKNGNQYQRLYLKKKFETIKNEYGNRNDNVIWGFSCISDKRCAHSMKYDGDWNDFKDYPDGLPLATDECSLDKCTCGYLCTVKRDNNGKIIYTDR